MSYLWVHAEIKILGYLQASTNIHLRGINLWFMCMLPHSNTIQQVYLPGSGDTLPLSLTAALQGAVYIYRNDTTALQPVLYQLDAWHEASHPSHWAATQAEYMVVEAEMFSGTPTAQSVVHLYHAIVPCSCTAPCLYVPCSCIVPCCRAAAPCCYTLLFHGVASSLGICVRDFAERYTQVSCF